MRYSFLLAAIVSAGLLSACKSGGPFATSSASIEPTELRCEYLRDPLGMDVTEPRLGWILKANNPSAGGQFQTALQVIVSSTPELLQQNQGDLWNSGELRSGETLHLAYAGTPLKSGQQCYWKVRVRDERERWSRWSQPAMWTMGILQPAEWQAQWIGAGQAFTRKGGNPPPDNTVPDPWFRKNFQLDRTPTRAFICVASVGYHELYVNGKKASADVLNPAVTDHTKRARYVTYEIGPMLQKGENTLALWLGVSWSIFPPYKTPDKPQAPIVLAQGEIQFADAPARHVVTDDSWKTHPSPNTLLGVWDFMHMGGELYDARQEVPNWNRPGFDDSAWQSVAVHQPKLRLSAQMVEPNRVLTPIKAVSVQTLSNGVYRVDMGRNFAGWMEVDVAGEPGSRVDFEYSEDPRKLMTHRIRSAYIIGESGKGTFRNRFNYHSGRWITVRGLKSAPKASDFRGWLVRTAYEPASEFVCNNPLLNRIQETTLWTFENLTLGGYVVDCPQRERMGYGGDAHATTELGMQNYLLGAFYTKWAEDWRDVQGKSSAWGVGIQEGVGSGKGMEAGNLPYTAPTYWGGGGPGWSGYCVTLPWLMYRYYGDARILNQNFATITAWLGFLESKSKDDLLIRWGGEWDFLGDWLWPGAKGVNGDTPETLFFNNCYWVFNLDTASRIATVLGKQAEAKQWAARADQVRRAIHGKFYNASDASYVNGFQGYLAMALLTQIPPAEVRPAVWQRLEKEILDVRKGHIHAGITAGGFLFKTLLEHDRADLLYPMAIKETYPSWGDFLKDGATTMYESWEGTRNNHSLLHSSYLYVGTLPMQGLLGIHPGPQGGYRHFELRPAILEDLGLTKAQGSYDSYFGKISVQWEIANGELTYKTIVPPNTTATLWLPARSMDAIKSVSRNAAILRSEKGRIAFELEPGKHVISIRLR